MDLAPTIAALNENDPETLKIRSPVQVEQGTADTTVLPLFTNQLAPKLKANGVKLTYKTYPGVDHAGRCSTQGRRGRDEVREAARLG